VCAGRVLSGAGDVMGSGAELVRAAVVMRWCQ